MFVKIVLLNDDNIMCSILLNPVPVIIILPVTPDWIVKLFSINTLLKYKLDDRGKQLLKIDKWFPSSKMCNVCGKVNTSLTLQDREWTCECGAKHDRDVNAAINIYNVGLRTVGITGIAQWYL